MSWENAKRFLDSHLRFQDEYKIFKVSIFNAPLTLYMSLDDIDTECMFMSLC